VAVHAVAARHSHVPAGLVQIVGR